MDYKNGKWASQILKLRHNDGLWGNFHTLSVPTKQNQYTTEQALRRLLILGYDKNDEPIKMILERMELCLKGERKIDNYSEKSHDWILFEKMMLSAWIRMIEPQNEFALEVAYFWASIAEKAFETGTYNKESNIKAFTQLYGRKPKSGFETGFGMFYHAVLLKGVLTPKTESLFLDYYLSKPDGMYYIYSKPLNLLPDSFASIEASRFLSAHEVFAEYDLAKGKLQFVVDWLNANIDENNQWDFSAKAKDGVCFPLSDSWRKEEIRKADCTKRVESFIQKHNNPLHQSE